MPEGWLARFNTLLETTSHPALSAFRVPAEPPVQPRTPITRPKGAENVPSTVPSPAEHKLPREMLVGRLQVGRLKATSVRPKLERPAKDELPAKKASARGAAKTEEEALRRAVQEARTLGAVFRIIGADVDIECPVDLPEALQAELMADRLYAHLGAARADQEAVELLAALGVSAVLATDIAGADAAMRALDGADIISLDFETGPRDPRPEPVRLNRDGTASRIQPAASKLGLDPYRSEIQTAQLYADGDRAYIFHGAGLEHLLSSDWFARQNYVSHNAGFECKFAMRRGLDLRLQCTKRAYGVLYGVENHNRKGHSRDLADAAKAVLGLEPPKKLQTSCWSAPRLSRGQIAYAAADPVLVYRLWAKLEPQVRSNRLDGYDLQVAVIPAVADMELRGMGFDRDRHAQLTAELQAAVAMLEAKIIAMTGKPAPTGKNETQEWVKAVAGPLLPDWSLTKTGLLSTTAADYARLEGVPEAKLILELRAKKTLLASFGDSLASLVNPVTGRINGNYNTSGAKSGRFSCSKPNLQNQPGRKKSATHKSVFAAATGYSLISGDLKQVELRGMAAIAGCPDMTAVFEAGEDIHAKTVLSVAGKPCDQIGDEEWAVLRDHAKALNFSTIYGVTGKGFAEILWKNYGIRKTEAEGEQALAAFFATYPRVRAWMLESYVAAVRDREIRIGVGRIVRAVWEEGGEISRQQAANLPVQGACADVMLVAMRLIYERLRDAGINGGVIASVHDEIVAEVADADVARTCRIIEEAMTEAFLQIFPGAPTTGGVVDIEVGPSWGEMQAPKK